MDKPGWAALIFIYLVNEQKFIYICQVKQKDDNKISHIFSATLKLVVEIGIAGITMRQIAQKAQIATGTLYIYFKDKDDLIHQLYMDCRQATIHAYLEGYDPAKDFKEGFQMIWMNILKYRIENFDMSVFMEQSFHSPFISESAKEMSRHMLKPLYKLMDRGKEEKIIKDIDTNLLLISMIGSIAEVIKFVKYHKKKLTDEIIQDAFSICWDGLTIKTTCNK